MLSSILTVAALALELPHPRWNVALTPPGAGIARIQRKEPDATQDWGLHNGRVDPSYNLLGLGLERIFASGWTLGGDGSAWANKGGIDFHIDARGGVRRVVALGSRWELALDAGAGPSYFAKTYDPIKLHGFGGQHTLLAAARIGSELDWRFRNDWVLGLRPRFDGAVAVARFGDSVWSDGDQGRYLANKTFVLSAAMDVVLGF